MKKLLVGCGVALLLGLVGLGGTVAYCGHVAKEMAGGVYDAMTAAARMSLDRMEQEAVDVAAADVRPRLAELQGRPVRVKGDVMVVKTPDGQTPAGFDEGAVMFVAPNLMIIAMGPDIFPARRPAGLAVEVVGVAATIELSKAPGMTERSQQQLVEQFGGTQMPVVVARKVSVVADPPSAAP